MTGAVLCTRVWMKRYMIDILLSAHTLNTGRGHRLDVEFEDLLPGHPCQGPFRVRTAMA